jgi:CheY-like chemotaxis protein
MNNKVLFLGSGSPFMMNAVMGNLSTSGYDVMSVAPDVASVLAYGASHDIVVLFLGETLLENEPVLRAIGEIGGAPNRLFFVIGDDDEVACAKDYFPPKAITASFPKPLNIKRFLMQVDHLVNDPHKREMPPILLVDDDADYLKMVKGWISRKYRVAIVNSGMQAATYLANNKPSLILLDYSMPVLGGPQVLEMIRSEPATANIPVIFLTGKDDAESVQTVLSLKPDGYILKNIGRDALIERLDEFFASKK